MSVPQKLRTYITTIVAILILSIGLPATQVLDGSVPAFELTALLFGTQAVLVLPTLLYHRLTLRIPRQHIPYMFVSVLANIIQSTCFYTASQYLPVGSTESLGAALMILLCTIVSIVQKSSSKVMLSSAILSMSGIILVIQPPVLFNNANLHQMPPINWTSVCKAYNSMESNHTRISSVNITNAIVLPSQGGWIGYLLMGIYAISYATVIQVLPYLVEQVPYQVVTFYLAVCSALLSIVVMGFSEVPSFPNQNFCVAMVLTFCLVCSQYNCVITYSLQEIHPTVVSLLISMPIPLEIIYQYTFMHDINPGHGNWVEILGCVICFLGTIGTSLWDVVQSCDWFSNRNKNDCEEQDDQNEAQPLLAIQPCSVETENSCEHQHSSAEHRHDNDGG